MAFAPQSTPRPRRVSMGGFVHPSASTTTSSAASSLEPPLSPAERVTRAIAALLARGVRPWVRPWSADRSDVGPLALPLRSCGTPYRGMNIVALWALAMERGFAARRWFTFKQALALDACVRKGERGSFVVFYTELGPKGGEDGDDAPSAGSGPASGEAGPKRRILRGYVAFNADQIDGLPAEVLDAAPVAPVTASPIATGAEADDAIDLEDETPGSPSCSRACRPSSATAGLRRPIRSRPTSCACR